MGNCYFVKPSTNQHIRITLYLLKFLNLKEIQYLQALPCPPWCKQVLYLLLSGEKGEFPQRKQWVVSGKWLLHLCLWKGFGHGHYGKNLQELSKRQKQQHTIRRLFTLQQTTQPYFLCANVRFCTHLTLCIKILQTRNSNHLRDKDCKILLIFPDQICECYI